MADQRQHLRHIVEQLAVVRDEVVPDWLGDFIEVVRERTASMVELVERGGVLNQSALNLLIAVERHLNTQVRDLADDLAVAVNDAMDEVNATRRPVVHVSSMSKTNREILRRPPPETIVIVDDVAVYTTDQHGRVVNVEALITVAAPSRRRNKYAERTVRGKIPGDHAGHLVARVLGGIGDKINLVAMAAQVNLGAFATLERRWRTALDRKQPVEVRLSLRYKADDPRPSTLTVVHRLAGGHSETIVIQNPMREGT